MEAKPEEVLKDLKKAKYQPVYFLQGEEPYYIDLISDFVENNVLSESERSFNQVILYGKESPMATILTNARRFPMMAERQVVIVKEAQEIPDLNKESGAKLLLHYLEQPVSSTILVFCHKHKSLDKRRELGKKISKLALTVTTKKFYDNQLPEFIQAAARSKGIELGDEAANVFCEYVGNSLSRLVNELDKIILTLKEGESISPEMVMRHVGVSKEYNVFELQRALVNRDLFQATRVLNYFEQNPKKNPAIPAVALLHSFFSKLLIASRASDKSKDGLLNALKISPYAVRDYIFALNKYAPHEVIRGLAYLREADLRLKGVDSGSMSESQVLRELITKLIRPAA